MNNVSIPPKQSLTPASVMAALAALLVSAFLTQWVEVVLFTSSSAELAVPLPAVFVLALLISTVTLAGFARLRLLSRSELVTIYFILAISAPLMTQGFWQRIVAISKTLPQSQDFSKFDSLSERLWPHGANYLDDFARKANDPATIRSGNVRFEKDRLILSSPSGRDAADEPALIRFPIPLGQNGFQPGESVLFSFLIRISDFGTESLYSSGFRVPENGRYLPVVEGRTAGRPNPILPEGMTRVGQYNVMVPESNTGTIWLEISLRGGGSIEVSDPRIFSVSALEALESGLQRAGREQFPDVPIADQARTLIAPEPWSLSWLLERLGIGVIPWKAWAEPIALWSFLICSLLMGGFGINLLMRRRWVDGERVPLPLTRIPLMMLGEPLQPGDEPIRFWRNPLMWSGFALAFIWAGLRGWHFYNPGLPDLNILIPIQSYFDPSWGRTWQITFSVTIVVVAMAIFVDSSILLSVVVGFFLFRLLFFVGMTTGWDAHPRYPYAPNQQIGGFFAYTLVLLFFARRQIMEALRTRGDGARTGLVMVILSFVGAALWGWLNGMAPWQTTLWMGFLLMISLVSTRFRVECGTPGGYFTPTNSSYIFFLIGGFGLFGNDFLLTSYTFSYVLLSSVFFLIPGAQFEYMEINRRLNIPLRQTLGASAIGVIGGIVIGGFVFLLVAYSFGAVSLVNNWTLSSKLWYFSEFNAEMARAAATTGQVSGGAAPETIASWLGLGYGAFGVMVISLLRQLVASFWFHPFGFIVGSTPFASELWGSILAAWAIRSITLKLGGARMLRYGLQPFFGGVFLGGVAAWILFALIGTLVLGGGSPLIYNRIP